MENPGADGEVLCNIEAEEETGFLHKKRSRLVSFADTTFVHVLDRDDDFETPPDPKPNLENPEELGQVSHGKVSTEKEAGGDDVDSREANGNCDAEHIERFVLEMRSPGSANGSVTSNEGMTRIKWADEWNVNKWVWEGILKVVSKGKECVIRLEDKSTGELYAQAFLRNGEPHPVEPVIDSSRYFVLRVEENFDGRIRHAFIGIGFRERPQAYDFQAALHDHMKYLNKKQAAEEMEQNYSSKPSMDYSLKEGEKLVLHIKNVGSSSVKSIEQNQSPLSSDDKPTVSLKPPPPPPPAVKILPSSPIQKSPPYLSGLRTQGSLDDSFPHFTEEPEVKEAFSSAKECATQNAEDDFGDFQTAP